MSSYLRTLHPNIDTYIPDRYAEGYGVSYMGIDYAHDNDMTLIIALDCGVKAIEKVAYAKKKASTLLFVIITVQEQNCQMPWLF